MNASKRRLCGVEEIADLGTRSFVIERNGAAEDMFIVRRGEEVFAYINSCPHTGGPLDWLPDQFLDLDRRYIQCASHDALFQINDGVCVAGPCKGQSLSGVEICVEDGAIWLVQACAAS